jgi:opacity protein-like surface antigen
MKKTLLTVALLAAFGVARADILRDVNNGVGISVGASILDYKELDNGQFGRTPDSETGAQFSAQVNVVRDESIGPVNNVYTALFASLATGPITYDGYQIDMASKNKLGAPNTYSHKSSYFDLGVRLGKTFRLGQKFQLTPYVSYDYHYWSRLSFEQYDHHEVGGGILAQYAMTDKLVLGLDANAAEVIGAKATSSLPDEKLSSKPSYSLSVIAEYAVNKRLHLTASYTHRHFAYGQSGGVAGTFQGIHSDSWYEPASRTNTNTFMIGAKYVF